MVGFERKSRAHVGVGAGCGVIATTPMPTRTRLQEKLATNRGIAKV